jgi:hypothetical protein
MEALLSASSNSATVSEKDGHGVLTCQLCTFIADMGRPGRKVERIVDRNSGHAIWGKPF